MAPIQMQSIYSRVLLPHKALSSSQRAITATRKSKNEKPRDTDHQGSVISSQKRINKQNGHQANAEYLITDTL